MNLLDALLERIEYYAQHEWSKADEVEAERCLLDYTGVALAGANQLEAKINSYLERGELHAGNNLIVNSGKKADVYSAVLLNALCAHTLELDDGHRYGMLHPGVTVISALIPVLENGEVSPEGFLKSIAIGYEATIRLACMVQPEHKKRGFHATATCGTFGAAVAVCYARGYNREQIKCAASAALTSASGLLEMIDDDSEMKPYNCAQAAVNGLLAADIANCGYRPPVDALGGKRGFIMALNGEIDELKVKNALEMKNCIGTIYRKMYASCRHTHPSVEGALNIRNQYPDKVNDVKKIEIETYDLAVFGHDHVRVGSISSAKMSTPYSVAVALLFGKSGFDAFTDELLADNSVKTLAEKVTVQANDELSALSPQKRAAIIKVTFGDGTVAKERVDYPKGEPENRLSDAELLEKFSDLAIFAGKKQSEILGIIQHLKNFTSKSELFLESINKRMEV